MAQPAEQPDAQQTAHPVRSSSRRHRLNRAFEIVCMAATGLAILILAVLLISILTQGIGSLNLNFLTAVSSSDPDKAGVSTALVGTIVICLICALSAIPLGVGTAVLIEEFKPKHPVLVRVHGVLETNIRNLAGVPSIVYGLLGIGAFVFMFNLFGPINNGSFAIGQTWYDQYTDATGKQLYLPLDGPDDPLAPLYAEPVDTPTKTEVWRTTINPSGEEIDTPVIPALPSGQPAEMTLTVVDGAWRLVLDQADADLTRLVEPGDEARFNPYFDPVLNRAFYSSFLVAAVGKNHLDLAGGPITTLIDARDGSGQPVEYTLVSRESLQPKQTRIDTGLKAFGDAIRFAMRDYRVRTDDGFITQYPDGKAKSVVEQIVDNALTEYDFDDARLDQLRPQLVNQLLALDGATSTKTRAERNRIIQVIGDRIRDEELGGEVLLGQNPTRIDTKSWYHFALPLGRGVLTGGLTLMLVILPIVIVASQEALRGVPGSFRQGALALGATPWQTVSKTSLPAAGIATGVILAVSRAIGEAAPILVIGAAGYVSRSPAHLMDGFSALPVTIFQWTREPGTDFRGIAAAGIIVLLIVLLSFNAVAIYIRQRAGRHH
ncbi:MAG: ABC transporter permease subunit [Phycisphaeraceae bacterium]